MLRGFSPPFPHNRFICPRNSNEEDKKMASIRQYASSRTNWANAIWLALVVMLGSWDIAFVEKWMTPETVAFGSLVLNVVMRKFTQLPLESK